jgi:16S rRNA (uracil1498-N3)-methyltransferase
LLLSPAAALPLRDLAAPTRMLLLIGPEGGLSPQEMELARSREFLPVRLGPRILRTETAALAALSAIQALWGDF